MQKQRPKHLDLAKIRLPVPGIVSILHRISGVALFFSLPILIIVIVVQPIVYPSSMKITTRLETNNKDSG